MQDEVLNRRREQRTRRAVAKAGFVLVKSRSKIDPQWVGKYWIKDVSTGGMLNFGGTLDCTLEDIEAWLQQLR